MRRLAALVVVTSACAAPRVEVVHTNPPPRLMAPRSLDQLRVYVGRRPAEPHVDVAMLTPPAAGTYGATRADAIAALRTAAAELGCDGIVLDGGERPWGACVAFDPPLALPASPAARAAMAVLERVFPTLDLDGDGALSGTELPGSVVPRMSEIDANGDGALTPDELRGPGAR